VVVEILQKATFVPLPTAQQKPIHKANSTQVTIPPTNKKSISKKYTKLLHKQTIPKPSKFTPKTDQFLTQATLNEAITTSLIFPKDVPVKADIGKLGLMWPRGIALQHRAKNLLNFYSEKGCPADCDPPWSLNHIIQALKQGPHISALSKDERECLNIETQDKIKGGYAKVITWKDIKNKMPTNLKISPIAIIPHKSRKFQAILDLSFQMQIKGKKMPSVSSATNIKAPQKSMAELGNVLHWIIHTMAQNHNKKIPFAFSKCNIKDGFWQMVVSHEDAWNFCYVLPGLNKTTPLNDIQIVFPHSLQMGWCKSPPFFCAATETGQDVIQQMLHKAINAQPHPMEHYLMDNAPAIGTKSMGPSVNLFEVFVNDFVGITNNLTNAHLLKLLQTLLHGIHCIFPPPSVSGHNGGDPLSEKKMQQGDGQWSHTKEILGWIFNGSDYTIELPPNKAKKIEALIKGIQK
jgi:hypothetical protein